MSKERWLLQRVFSNWGYPRDIDLLKEIRELLAQPEQPTREPLSDEKVMDYLIDQSSYDYKDGFTDGVKWAEEQHKIGEL